MKRRDFFKSGLIGLSLPSFIFGNTKKNTNKNNPVILTTWNYPMANEAAIKSLKNNGNEVLKFYWIFPTDSFSEVEYFY